MGCLIASQPKEIQHTNQYTHYSYSATTPTTITYHTPSTALTATQDRSKSNAVDDAPDSSSERVRIEISQVLQEDTATCSILCVCDKGQGIVRSIIATTAATFRISELAGLLSAGVPRI